MFGKIQHKRKSLTLLKNMGTTKCAMGVCGCVNKKGKKIKMKRQHTEKYILKIAAEFGYTPYEIKSQVNEYLGDNLLYYQAINYLRDLKADDIRFILRFNKW
jgi:AraC-like DNA-binding protein